MAARCLPCRAWPGPRQAREGPFLMLGVILLLPVIVVLVLFYVRRAGTSELL